MFKPIPIQIRNSDSWYNCRRTNIATIDQNNLWSRLNIITPSNIINSIEKIIRDNVPGNISFFVKEFHINYSLIV